MVNRERFTDIMWLSGRQTATIEAWSFPCCTYRLNARKTGGQVIHFHSMQSISLLGGMTSGDLFTDLWCFISSSYYVLSPMKCSRVLELWSVWPSNELSLLISYKTSLRCHKGFTNENLVANWLKNINFYQVNQRFLVNLDVVLCN